MATRSQVIVVTGASAGVGRAVARAYGHRRARLGLIARDADRLQVTAQEVERAGGAALVLAADVSDAAQLDAAADSVEKTYGPIDVWINNAMVSVFSPVKDMTPDEFKRVTDVTYLGYVYGTLSALRRMLPRNRGVIVQVGSALAYRAIPLQSAYCAAKHAVQGFTESLRCELLHDGSAVRVTMVQLPALNTPQFEWSRTRLPRSPQPVPPIFQPEVAARAILWAADHHRRELYVGGSTVLAILANKIAPGLADRYLARTGYAAQQTDEPAPVNRPDNLWQSVPGDRGAHGPFGARARRHSLQCWLTIHRRAMIAGLAAAAAAVVAIRKRGGSSGRRRIAV